MPSLTLHISGMDCAACARTIETGVSRLPGVETCSLQFTTEMLRVEGSVSREAVEAMVHKLGYAAADKPTNPGLIPARPLDFWAFLLQRTTTLFALVGAVLILPGLLFDELLPQLGLHHPAFAWMALGALLAAGWPVARSAWRALTINREININFLMTTAALGAVIIGAYTEAGLVMVLFAFGEALEGYSAERARRSIRGLMEEAPLRATVLRPCMDCPSHLGQQGYTGGPCPFCGVEAQVVGVEALVIGDTVVVRPGEKIPADGCVLTGVSSVDQAAITGESMPVLKEPGGTVFAGTVNGEGVLEVGVTRLAEDTAIRRVIRMVEEATEQKAPAQRFVDRFAQVYTPLVVGVAALVAIAPPLLWGAPFWNPEPGVQGWFYRALALLVVACPCALVISTPVTLVSAISAAARHGVLVKGGAHLEALSRVRAMAFDKTGTLTHGQPEVVAFRSSRCTNPNGACEPCDDLLALASAVETRSEHPLARAVVAASETRNLHKRYAAAETVTALAGRGVTGNVGGQVVFVGSHPYFDARIPHTREQCAEAGSSTGTPVLVSVDEVYSGYITMADTPRGESAPALTALREAGVRHLVMLTGDDERAARAVAQAAGLADFRANLLPEQKVAAVRELVGKFHAVAMVGDGINDTPALAAASVGIAMGAGGTHQAMETADIVLMGDDLAALPFAVRLSQAAMGTVRANIGFALGLKAVFLVVVLAGVGSLWLAVLADVGATLVVTLNGMRMGGYSPRSRPS